MNHPVYSYRRNIDTRYVFVSNGKKQIEKIVEFTPTSVAGLLKFVRMQTENKHTTTRKNYTVRKATLKKEVIYITKTEVPAGTSLFAPKLKKVNKMLENAVLLK